MELSIGEIITAGSFLVGAATALGALNYRVRILEKGEKLETVRTDQGRRIGDMEDRVAKLEGFMLGARYRRKTRPHGGEAEPDKET